MGKSLTMSDSDAPIGMSSLASLLPGVAGSASLSSSVSLVSEASACDVAATGGFNRAVPANSATVLILLYHEA